MVETPSWHHQLSIIMPTFRFDQLARQALTCAAMAGGGEVCVQIGDNSEDPEKHAFLRQLARSFDNVVVHCHEKNIGAYANWMFLLNAATTPYVCLAADDDYFVPTYFYAGLRLIKEDKDCSAASGLFVSTASAADCTQLVLSNQPKRTEPTALERMSLYRGQNSIAYAVTRRDIVSRFIAYIKSNPLGGAFDDFILSFHILACGTYLVDPSAPAYVYDNAAWQFPAAEWRSGSKYYIAFGMPEAFQHFFKLHWAVANAHFFESRFRAPELGTAEASKIAFYLFNRLREEFIWDISNKREKVEGLIAHDPRAKSALSNLIGKPFTSTFALYEEFSHLVSAFAPSIAAQLLAFQTETLLPPLQRVRQEPGGTDSKGVNAAIFKQKRRLRLPWR